MNNRAQDYAAKALSPLIKRGQKTPALYARLAEMMTKMTGDKFFRQEVAAWLHPEESKRTEPRLGAGLLLIKANQKVKV